MKKIISTNVVEVKSNGTISTKKPSCITLSVDHSFAVEASMFFIDKKKGEETDRRLKGFELVAVFEDEEVTEYPSVKAEQGQFPYKAGEIDARD